MSLTTSEMSPADLAAVCGNNRNNGDGGMWDGNGAWWIIILLLFGWGGRGFGGYGGFGSGNGGNGCGCCNPCATQADLAAGFNNSTVLSNLDDIKLGQANAINYNNQGFNGLNTAILQGFHGVDNAICTLGYQQAQGVSNLASQLAQCCCDTRYAIGEIGTGIERNGWQISKQISDCCCDIEKMNLQSRFDAQAYNCNTLQAIDKLGDRIIDYMSNEKVQALRDENQALRLAASQSAQNAFITANQEAQTAELIRRLGLDRATCPIPAYVVQPPQPVTFSTNCCGQANYANNGCGCNGF